MGPATSSPRVEAELAEELAGFRARLLRRAAIAHRGRVLDLGAGHGLVGEELRRRARGPVVGVDRAALADGAMRLRADAARLPFREASFELAFAQHFFLWVGSLEPVLAEVGRVLERSGLLLAIEPDFTGSMEQPPEIAIGEIWRAALQRAGARVDAGSALAATLGRLGWGVEMHLPSAPSAPSARRFDRLEGLPLTQAERAHLQMARVADQKLPAAARFVHLPYVGILAKPPA